MKTNINKNIMDDMEIIIKDNNNHIGESQFEGYSPEEMVLIMYDLFGDSSLIKFQRLTEKEYNEIPLLNQIQYIIKLIRGKGRLKLTTKGFFPPKVVADIYHQGFLKDYLIEAGISKLHLEKNVQTINLARNLLEMSGLAKKRHGYLSLTKKGERCSQDTYLLLISILKIFFNKFNWGYYDAYYNDEAGRLGIGFTLILLSKYGDKKRESKFYSNKYYAAFPFLLNEFNDTAYTPADNGAGRCYFVRTFARCLDYLGLVFVEETHSLSRETRHVTKTKLFDKLIKIYPHKSY